MQKTASNYQPFPSEALRARKPEISACEFGEKRKEFIETRLQQFSERRNMKMGDVLDLHQKPGGYREIDHVVDEHLHSSMCPDPTDYIII